MWWCFGPPAVASDELMELDTVRRSRGGKNQRLRKSEDSAFETDLVRVASFNVRGKPVDDDWGLSPSRQASFCSLRTPSDAGSAAGSSSLPSAGSSSHLDHATAGRDRDVTAALSLGSSLEGGDFCAALAAVELPQRSASVSHVMEPLAGHQRYRKLKNLQRGTATSFVQLALNLRSGERSAVKFIERGDIDAIATLHRLLAHRACSSHPNVVTLQEVFLTPGYLAVATEYADGGSLADFQRRIEHASGMTEVPARALFQQMAVAVDFCHRRGVTLGGFGFDAWLLDRAPARPALRRHTTGGSQDDSPVSASPSSSHPAGPALLPMARKLSLSSGKYTVRLADFSGAVLAGAEGPEDLPQWTTSAAAPAAPSGPSAASHFYPPEVQQGSQHSRAAADTWSLGMSLYVLLMGAPPSSFESPRRHSSRFRRFSQQPLYFGQHVSSGCKEVLTSLLAPAPAQRALLADVLSHPWFKQDLSAELSTMNAQLLAESPHGAAWPPLAAVALAAPQSPETLRHLASLGSSASSAPAPAAAPVVQTADCQEWYSASAPSPAAERQSATPPAESLNPGAAGGIGQEIQQPQWQQADWTRNDVRAAAVRGSRSMDLDRSQHRPQWAPDMAGAAARRLQQPPLLQHFAVSTEKGLSLGVQRRVASFTSVTAELAPQRSCGSAGSIVQSSVIETGGLDHGPAVDM